MKLPSPSKLELAKICRFPFNGPIRWPGFDAESGSTATQHGRAVHLVAELTCKGEPVDLDKIAADHSLRGNDDETFRKCAAKLVEKLTAVRSAGTIEEEHFEISLAYDVEKNAARVLGPKDRVRAGEQRGHIDWLYRAGGLWVVVDHKTGRAARSTRCAETEQMRWYAVAVRALHGVDEVAVQLWHVTDYDDVWIDPAHFFAWDLDVIHTEQLEIVESVKRPSLPVFGVHCADMYCPILSQCPAAQKAVTALEQATNLRHPLSTTFESAEHAAYVWEMADIIIAAGKHLKTAAAARIKEHGLPLALMSGERVGIIQKRGVDKIKCDATTAQILQDHLGNAAKDAVKLSTTKKAIRAVANKVANRGDKGKLAARIFDDLREAGTLTKRPDWPEVGLLGAAQDDDDDDDEAA